MTFAVVTFPGSNCDRDCLYAVSGILGYPVRNVFHKETSLGKCDAVIIPGGFSYGDYLRCGAIAKLSPIMADIRRFAESGGPIIGICNGFQILCEAGLLPGALIRNRDLQFISRVIQMTVETNDTMFTSEYQTGQVISMPIAHGEGCYVADDDTINHLEENGRVVLRYCGPAREAFPDGNPNGSRNRIAGIVNASGNILGLMPHPERVCDPRIGLTDGAGIFISIANAVQNAMQKRSALETAS